MASNNLSRFPTSLSATLGRNSSSNNTGQQSASDPDDKSQDVEAAMAEVIDDEDPDMRPKVFRNAFEECIFVFTVMLSTASTTFLQGVIVINTATIGASLHMVPIQIVWISAAIGLASGSFVLFFGKTADLFGRKHQLLVGMVFLGLISLISAYAPNAISMNVLCGLLGLGTAAIAPPAVGTLFATYPLGRRRQKAAGALGAGNPVGFILGSISAGLATKLFSWRASFIVIAVFFFTLALLAFWTMPSTPRSGELKLAAKQFDYFGTALIIIGMATFSAALTEGPESGWTSFKVITILATGGACLFGFAVWENVYTHPLLDPSVWKNKNFTLCILCTLFGYMSFITNQFWISLYMQDVQHYTPLEIAVRLLPQAVVGILWSYIGQYLVSRMCGTTLMGVGALAYIAGATLLIFIRQDTPYWYFLFPALCITVLGADFQFIVANLYINKHMRTESSLAAGVLQTAMRLSISLGLAITSAVYMSTGRKLRVQTDVNFPFERVYLCSIIFASVGILFVPFMRLNTRGKWSPSPLVDEVGSGDHRQDTVGQRSIRTIKDDSQEQERRITTLRSSDSSGNISTASHDSQDSYFQRFSWEGNHERRHSKQVDGVEMAFYEVCVKCQEMRCVVVVTPDHIEDSSIPEEEPCDGEKDLEK